MFRWLKESIAVCILAVVPTASIVVLYAIPNVYGRLGAIVAESSALILWFAYSKSATTDIFAFMAG